MLSKMMQNLGSDAGCSWMMCMNGTGEWLPATVPGSVYQDLLDNRKMEDPYYRDNELKALELMDNDFTYVTEFEVEEELAEYRNVLLHFDGIDTLAEVFLNGQKLANVNNMHRTWEFPVADLLHVGKNELKVVLFSPTKYVAAEEELQADGCACCLHVRCVRDLLRVRSRVPGPSVECSGRADVRVLSHRGGCRHPGCGWFPVPVPEEDRSEQEGCHSGIRRVSLPAPQLRGPAFLCKNVWTSHRTLLYNGTDNSWKQRRIADERILVDLP